MGQESKADKGSSMEEVATLSIKACVGWNVNTNPELDTIVSAPLYIITSKKEGNQVYSSNPKIKSISDSLGHS